MACKSFLLTTNPLNHSRMLNASTNSAAPVPLACRVQHTLHRRRHPQYLFALVSRNDGPVPHWALDLLTYYCPSLYSESILAHSAFFLFSFLLRSLFIFDLILYCFYFSFYSYSNPRDWNTNIVIYYTCFVIYIFFNLTLVLLYVAIAIVYRHRFFLFFFLLLFLFSFLNLNIFQMMKFFSPFSLIHSLLLVIKLKKSASFLSSLFTYTSWVNGISDSFISDSFISYNITRYFIAQYSNGNLFSLLPFKIIVSSIVHLKGH